MNIQHDNSQVITLCAAGDVSLCDGVEEQIYHNGIDFPFAKIKQIFDDSDISFANLENVFSNCNEGKRSQAHLLKSSPENIQAIINAGFNVVSLANNHILDYGEQGLKETISILDIHKIRHCGAGETLPMAREPIIFRKKGIKFGLLAYAMKGVQSASVNRAGYAWIDYKLISEDMFKIRPKVDHIIISLHAGLEFIDYPHPDHRNLCLKIAKSGASLILGHHPHVFHGIEKVNNCLIVYSLGNLIFDTNLMDYRTERSQQGLLLKCRFNKDKLIDYEIIPTVININFQPEIADNYMKDIIIQRLENLSDNLVSNYYPKVYFKQVSALWPKINIAVNLKIIKNHGLFTFLRRLPRIKKLYVVLLFRYVVNRSKGLFLKRND